MRRGTSIVIQEAISCPPPSIVSISMSRLAPSSPPATCSTKFPNELKNARNLLRQHEPAHYFPRNPVGSAFSGKGHIDLHTKTGTHFFPLSMNKDLQNAKGNSFLFQEHYRKHYVLPHSVRTLASDSSTSSQRRQEEGKRKDISTVEDPFDSLTDNIPEKPVTFTEGASYSIVILAGLGVAGLAAYAVFKELIFQPKEYKIFDKALERVQHDNQVTVRIGSPVTGYGSESRNRAARQRIANRVWTDENGVEHVEVNFYIRGPRGTGVVYTEMFRDNSDRKWKFTYLIVDIKSPSPAQIMLESYIPA